jgi:S-adenosylmethionine:diacylglycerol 3-amino-3-carboxypropyl transferase
MDWMSGFDPAALTAEWSAILARCPHGARVVFRSAAREVRYLDSIYVELDGRKIRLEDAIRPHPQLSRDLYARERTGIYGSFHVIDLRHGH